MNQGRRGRVGFEMSSLPTSANASFAGGIDDDVAALAAGAIFAVNGKIPDDDSAPDSRAQREEHNAMVLAPFADPGFAEGGCVGVVGKRHWRATERLRQQVANRRVIPAGQIVG